MEPKASVKTLDEDQAERTRGARQACGSCEAAETCLSRGARQAR